MFCRSCSSKKSGKKACKDSAATSAAAGQPLKKRSRARCALVFGALALAGGAAGAVFKSRGRTPRPDPWAMPTGDPYAASSRDARP